MQIMVSISEMRLTPLFFCVQLLVKIIAKKMVNIYKNHLLFITLTLNNGTLYFRCKRVSLHMIGFVTKRQQN